MCKLLVALYLRGPGRVHTQIKEEVRAGYVMVSPVAVMAGLELSKMIRQTLTPYLPTVQHVKINPGQAGGFCSIAGHQHHQPPAPGFLNTLVSVSESSTHAYIPECFSLSTVQ